LSWGQYFFRDIVIEGILLYDTNNFDFAAPRVLSSIEEKQKALDYFNIWYPQASEFLIDCVHAFERGNYKKGTFELHQAAESLYYSVLLVFTGYKPRIHNLWKLRKKAKPYSEELFLVFRAEKNKEEESLFDLLKRGYIDARYKPDFIISQQELSTLIDRVKKMQPIVERICKEKISSY